MVHASSFVCLFLTMAALSCLYIFGHQEIERRGSSRRHSHHHHREQKKNFGFCNQRLDEHIFFRTDVFAFRIVRTQQAEVPWKNIFYSGVYGRKHYRHKRSGSVCIITRFIFLFCLVILEFSEVEGKEVCLTNEVNFHHLFMFKECNENFC